MRIAYPLEEEWEPEKSFVLYTVSKEISGYGIVHRRFISCSACTALKRGFWQCARSVCRRDEVQLCMQENQAFSL
jgi:hypothetical protein